MSSFQNTTVNSGYTGVLSTGILVIPDRNYGSEIFSMVIPESLLILEYRTTFIRFRYIQIIMLRASRTSISPPLPKRNGHTSPRQQLSNVQKQELQK